MTDKGFLGKAKREIRFGLELILYNEASLQKAVYAVMLLVFCASVILFHLLCDMGQLWYVKVLILLASAILPYYVVTLMLELLRNRTVRNIPVLIDEFRGAFLNCRKVKPALKECSKNIDRVLARLVLRAAENPNFEQGLLDLRKQCNDTWMNIFVSLLLNYKEDGGELVTQLYRLNHSITRSVGLDKKRSRRLVLYEIFAIASALISIPVIFRINEIIVGNLYGTVIIDSRTNMAVARIILWSLFSLIIIRLLRKL